MYFWLLLQIYPSDLSLQIYKTTKGFVVQGHIYTYKIWTTLQVHILYN